MTARSTLRLLFSLILLGMIVVTTWASLEQPVWAFGGLKGPDRAWTIATLCDAYAGFLTFYAWVYFREQSALARASWLVAILLLGNMAMSAYVLIALSRLPADAPLERLLLRSEA
jgi:Protein of unknown function (DUF1475)